ncbi:MAG: hypothetical protein KJ587_10320 [Alphaproteobacteria bacterium]|nr:hypothetical protein [Alphaproteobacteria bacterium]
MDFDTGLAATIRSAAEPAGKEAAAAIAGATFAPAIPGIPTAAHIKVRVATISVRRGDVL